MHKIESEDNTPNYSFEIVEVMRIGGDTEGYVVKEKFIVTSPTIEGLEVHFQKAVENAKRSVEQDGIYRLVVLRQVLKSNQTWAYKQQ